MTEMRADTTPVIEWNMNKDKTIIPDAQHLRSLSAVNYHAKVFQSEDFRKKWVEAFHPYWRQQLLKKAALVMGKNFYGVGAEIGAGTGMYSALLSQIPQVEKIYCIDYSKEDVEILMPIVLSKMNADPSKVVRVVGSFNAMELEDSSLDFIIALGALHHSEDLGATAKECYRVLKHGGWLVASERVRPNTDCSTEIKKALETEFTSDEKSRLFKIDIKEKITRTMNSEHEPRLCEYEADFARAGFKVFAFIFHSPFGTLALFPFRFLHFSLSFLFGDFLLKKRRCAIGYSKISYYPWFAKGGFRQKAKIDPLLFTCQKI